MSFEQSHIWRTCLASREGDEFSSERERLRSSFVQMRGKVEKLVGEIAADMPDYTVHDITHLDALWEVASRLVGEDVVLNPAEAFVLGGAFLLHDASMSLAAYPHRKRDLCGLPEWNDLVCVHYQKRHGRNPEPAEIDDPALEIERAVISDMLRQLHAQHAEELTTQIWRDRDGNSYRLIDDDEIRGAYGETIGQVAHSHWWEIEDVDSKFGELLGSPYFLPPTWTVDTLKVACALRCADAAHIDARRAPSFLRAIRDVSEGSDEHWKFQAKLARPVVKGDTFQFSSLSSFGQHDAEAWWLCYDTLRMIDSELRSVDALLADRRGDKHRFLVRSVAGVELPERLSATVKVAGWEPLNASVHVSDIPSLVERLGGEELYGNDPLVPVRELIQNSADAVRAKRAISDLPDSWGIVRVELVRDDKQWWLEVEDNGTGMSRKAIEKYLLNFGASYWGSTLMREEYPGLFSQSVSHTGKFGIGFFSVFMLGDLVEVTTRRIGASDQDTCKLTFGRGIANRPILESGAVNKLNADSGTLVRVLLKNDPYEKEGLVRQSRRQKQSEFSFSDLCIGVAPSLDVKLVAKSYKGDVIEAHSNVWTSESSRELYEKLRPNIVLYADGSSYEQVDEWYSKFLENMRPISNEEGVQIGRAFLTPPSDTSDMLGSVRGVVTSGGLVSGRLTNIVGILEGEVTKASRDNGVPKAKFPDMAQWAAEQVSILREMGLEEGDQVKIASLALGLGAEPKGLKYVQTPAGNIDQEEFLELYSKFDEIIFLDDFYINAIKYDSPDAEFFENVVGLPRHSYNFLHRQGYSSFANKHYYWPHDSHRASGRTLSEYAASLMLERWGVSAETMAGDASWWEEHAEDEVPVATRDGIKIRRGCILLRKPT
ncbi:ATP-binding protein [Pyruvatibacter sp.]|uniref:HD domain-containing protein n=1 Tax=Pyruvatibacter sp. TaxID=1981328 RepID=UPI0032656386